MPIQRPRCFLTPPVECRVRILISPYAFLRPRSGDVRILAGMAACSLWASHSTRLSRRTSLRRPRQTAGMGGQPWTRPATTLHTCAFEQCRSSATAASVNSPKSSSPSMNYLPSLSPTHTGSGKPRSMKTRPEPGIILSGSVSKSPFLKSALCPQICPPMRFPPKRTNGGRGSCNCHPRGQPVLSRRKADRTGRGNPRPGESDRRSRGSASHPPYSRTHRAVSSTCGHCKHRNAAHFVLQFSGSCVDSPSKRIHAGERKQPGLFHITAGHVRLENGLREAGRGFRPEITPVFTRRHQVHFAAFHRLNRPDTRHLKAAAVPEACPLRVLIDGGN